MGTAQAWAQCTARNTAFLPGEHVSYDLMFNWKFIWIKVGTAELTTDTARYQGKDGYCFRLKSLTSKRADFFFKMRDTLTCYVTNRLEPLYFCKAAEEGKRHTKDEAWFSYVDGKSHVKQQRTWYKPARETNRMEYTAEDGCIFDMLSILGQARSLWSMMSKERRTRSSPSSSPTMTITCPSAWTCTSASARPRLSSAGWRATAIR